MLRVDPAHVEQLNTIVSRFEARASKDRRQIVGDLIAFVDAIAQHGVAPADALGQHIASNMMVLVTDNHVKPALSEGLGGAAGRRATPQSARQSVTRPLRSLVEALHKYLPKTAIAPPFCFKNARALDYLLRHILDVLQSDTLSSRYGMDYALLFTFLVEYDAYVEALSPGFVGELLDRLLTLLSDPSSMEPDELRAYAKAIESAVALPHWGAHFSTDTERQAAVARLGHVLSRTLQIEGNSTFISGHALLLRAAAIMVGEIGRENPSCAVPESLAGALQRSVDAWHTTVRKDLWRESLLLLAAHVAAVSCTPSSPASLRAQQTLQKSIFPWIVGVLDASKWEFGGTVSSDDLWRFQSPRLQNIVKPIAYLLRCSLSTYTTETPDSDAEHALLNGAAPQPQLKRSRSVSPIDVIIERVNTCCSGKITDSGALWLQALSFASTTSALPAQVTSQLLGTLMAAYERAPPTQEQPIAGALVPLLLVSTPSDRLRLWNIVSKRVASAAGQEVLLPEDKHNGRRELLSAVLNNTRSDDAELPLELLVSPLQQEALPCICQALRCASSASVSAAEQLCGNQPGFLQHIVTHVGLTGVAPHRWVSVIFACFGIAARKHGAHSEIAAGHTLWSDPQPSFAMIADDEPRGAASPQSDSLISPVCLLRRQDWMAFLSTVDAIACGSEGAVTAAVSAADRSVAYARLLVAVWNASPTALGGPSSDGDQDAADDDDAGALDHASLAHVPNEDALPIERRLEDLLAKLLRSVASAFHSARSVDLSAALASCEVLCGDGGWRNVLRSAIVSAGDMQPLSDALGMLSRALLDLIRRQAVQTHSGSTGFDSEANVTSCICSAARSLGSLLELFDATKIREFATDPLVPWEALATAIHESAARLGIVHETLALDDPVPPYTIVPPLASSLLDVIEVLSRAPAHEGRCWSIIQGLLAAHDCRFSVGSSQAQLTAYAAIANRIPPGFSALREQLFHISATVLLEGYEPSRRLMWRMPVRPVSTPTLRKCGSRVFAATLNSCSADEIQAIFPKVLRLAVSVNDVTRRCAAALIPIILETMAMSDAQTMLLDVFRTLKPAVLSDSVPVVRSAAETISRLLSLAGGLHSGAVMSAVTQFAATKGLKHRDALVKGLKPSTCGTARSQVVPELFDSLSIIAFDWLVKLGHPLNAFPAWFFDAADLGTLIKHPLVTTTRLNNVSDFGSALIVLAFVATHLPSPPAAAAESLKTALTSMASASSMKSATLTEALRLYFVQLVSLTLTLRYAATTCGPLTGVKASVAEAAHSAMHSLRLEFGDAQFDQYLLANAEDLCVGILRYTFSPRSENDVRLPYATMKESESALQELCVMLQRAATHGKSCFLDPVTFLAQQEGDFARHVLTAFAADAEDARSTALQQRVHRVTIEAIECWFLESSNRASLYTTHSVGFVLHHVSTIFRIWVKSSTHQDEVQRLTSWTGDCLCRLWAQACQLLGGACLRFLSSVATPLVEPSAQRLPGVSDVLVRIVRTAREVDSSDWQIAHLDAMHRAVNATPGLEFVNSGSFSQASAVFADRPHTRPLIVDVVTWIAELHTRGTPGAIAGQLFENVSSELERQHEVSVSCLLSHESVRQSLTQNAAPWLYATVRNDDATEVARRGSLSLLRVLSFAAFEAGASPRFLEVLQCATFTVHDHLRTADSADDATAIVSAHLLHALVMGYLQTHSLSTAAACACAVRNLQQRDGHAPAVSKLSELHPDSAIVVKLIMRSGQSRPTDRLPAAHAVGPSAAVLPAGVGLWTFAGSDGDNCATRLSKIVALIDPALCDALPERALAEDLAISEAAFCLAVVRMHLRQDGRKLPGSKTYEALSAGFGNALESYATPSAFVRTLLKTSLCLFNLHVGALRGISVSPRSTERGRVTAPWTRAHPKSLRECIGIDVSPNTLAQAAARIGEGHYAELFLQIECDSSDGMAVITRSPDIVVPQGSVAGVASSEGVRTHRLRARVEAQDSERTATCRRVVATLQPLFKSLGMHEAVAIDFGQRASGLPRRNRLEIDALTSPSTEEEAKLIAAIRDAGFWTAASAHTALLRQRVGDGDKLNELMNEATWRCFSWDSVNQVSRQSSREVPTGSDHRALMATAPFTGSSHFNGCIRELLHCRFARDFEVARALLVESSDLLVRSAAVDGPLVTIVRAQMMREARNAPVTPTRAIRCSTPKLDAITFQEVEPLAALRLVLCDMFPSASWSVDERLAISRQARKAGDAAYALRSLAPIVLKMDEVEFENQVFRDNILLAYAKAQWQTGDQHEALQLVHRAASTSAKASLQRTLWMRETGTVPTSTVVRDWLPTIAACGDAVASRAGMTLARLTDELFRAGVERMTSSEVLGYRARLDAAKEEGAQLRSRLESARSLPEHERKQLIIRFNLTEREIRRDEEARISAAVDSCTYRRTAMHEYARNLATASPGQTKHATHAAFRLLALWFTTHLQSFSHLGSLASRHRLDPPDTTVLTRQTVDVLEQVPASHLLSIFPQLVVRLGSPGMDAVSAAALDNSIFKVAVAHPQAALWPILALANGARYTDGEKAVHVTNEAKIKAARGMITALKQTSARGPLQQVQALSEAYLELAFQQLDGRGRSTVFRLSPHALLRQISHLSEVEFPSTHRTTASIVSFRDTFELPGGANAPKKVYCRTSDGKERKQIIKSRDDLRQDAIIEQFFDVCNALLEQNDVSRDRSLRTRTYRVTPLAPTSGVIEWVDNTTTIAEYLVADGDAGVHKRWYPTQISSLECRDRMSAAGSSTKRVEFDAICSEFTPAMHFFVVENFATPDAMLQARKQYTRSAAVGSILGYLVGLGDRHASNLLIDWGTAELVHIDLGIAFDQGTLLPVPERVPFRLTRDLVDGLGMLGIEGAFVFDAEAVLSTMRSNRELLATLCEAFLHDPLAKWAIAFPDADSHRRECQAQGTDDAERALARAREKLQGIDGGEHLGVMAHTRKLIHRATDRNLLSTIYHGWSAWL